MEVGSLLAASPVVGLLVNVLCQAACARLRAASLLGSVFVGFGVGALVCAGLAMSGTGAGQDLGGAAVLVLFCLATYGLIGYCYFHVVNMLVTARRIRILRQISLQPEGMMREEILAVYGARDMVAKRLARLLDKGQIQLEGGRYRLLPGAMRGITRAMRALKALVYGLKTR